MASREPQTDSLAMRIIEYLRNHPNGASDAELSNALQVRHHAQVNQVCNGLAASGRIVRLNEKRPFVNRLRDELGVTRLPVAAHPEPAPDSPLINPRRASARPLDSTEFESAARQYFSKLWNVELLPGSVFADGVVAKKFDLVSGDSRIVGDAKWYKNIPVPAAKFSTIAEYVWLLQHVDAERRFLVFGNDEEVPIRWLHRFGPVATPVEFYFFDGTTHRQLWPPRG